MRLRFFMQLSLKLNTTTQVQPDIHSYDRCLVAFSGGKDSIASLLALLEWGVEKSKIELHHHLVDGREGSDLFDWPVTEDYCRQFAQAFGIPIYFSWLEGGLEREMLRANQAKAATIYESPDTPKPQRIGGNSGKLGTRRKFPAMVADLRTRWCSSYGKIDVFAGLIRAQPRFYHSRTLVITGERAQESASRAKYQTFEPHRTDSRSGRLARHIDHWRPVHGWSEKQVWEKLREAKINPHPAYKLGFGRLSCARCIFSSPNQWATNMAIAPAATGRMMEYEEEFGHTIDAKWSIEEKAAKGVVYGEIAKYPELVEIAIGREYREPIFVEKWELPSGAFGEGNGSI
jgi:3'-phosphoadenosine 5'-phosphosulfate sulfotransferase (PAPS reductase)/FAD synthetase